MCSMIEGGLWPSIERAAVCRSPTRQPSYGRGSNCPTQPKGATFECWYLAESCRDCRQSFKARLKDEWRGTDSAPF